MEQIIKVKWIDICFYNGVERDYQIDETVGIDYGVDNMFGKDMQKVCYSRVEDESDNSIVNIPVDCIVDREVIGEIK